MSQILIGDEGQDIYSSKLSSLAPDEVLLLHRSEILAVVSVITRINKDPVIRRLEIPRTLKTCAIAKTLISYLNSRELGENSSFDIYSKLLKYKKLFYWAENNYKNKDELPACVIQDFILYLRKTTDMQQNCLCSYTAAFRTAFDWFIEKYHNDLSKAETINKLRDARSYIPSVSNRPAKPHPSLSQITNQEEKNELKILRSTIRFCFQFLKQMNDHRKLLLSYPEVEVQLRNLVMECNGDVECLKFNTKNNRRNVIYLPIANAIYQSESLELKERLLYNQYDYAYWQFQSNNSLTISEANAKIASGFRVNGSLNVQPKNISDALHFHNLDYLYLIRPTPAEEICFAWLLGTDRVQLSGVLGMSVDDLRIDKNFASPVYRKGRSSQKIREVPMHPRNSMQYRSYCDFSCLKKSYKAMFPDCGDMLVDRIPSTDILQCLASPIFRPIILVSFPQTKLFKELCNSDGEIKVFADIINRVAVHNQSLRRTNEFVKERMSSPSGKGVTTKRQTITVNIIAQSRAILDDYQADPKNEAYEKYSQEIVDADATAHSADVKRFNYIHASETKYRLDKRAAFASAVGQLMVEDARKVQAAVSASTFVSVRSLKVMLGWADESKCLTDIEEFDELLNLALSAGYNISPFGQLTKDSTVFIIINPISAALLLDYLAECVKQISLFTIEDTLRATAVAMQAAYIEEVLEGFDRKTIAKGHAALKKYRFPKPIVK